MVAKSWQLSVYLRLLEIPVPVIYGRSADEIRLLEALGSAAANHGTDTNPNQHAMSFDEHLAKRVRDALAVEYPAKERRMFGGLAFMVNGHMCCGIVGEDLAVPVGADEHEEALAQPHARAMDFTGRKMKGFVYVGASGYGTTAGLKTEIKRGLQFVLSLPPK